MSGARICATLAERACGERHGWVTKLTARSSNTSYAIPVPLGACRTFPTIIAWPSLLLATLYNKGLHIRPIAVSRSCKKSNCVPFFVRRIANRVWSGWRSLCLEYYGSCYALKFDLLIFIVHCPLSSGDERVAQRTKRLISSFSFLGRAPHRLHDDSERRLKLGDTIWLHSVSDKQRMVI